MPNRANLTIRLTLSIFFLSVFLTAAGAKTIYVDADAAGANDGSSWADAYTFLQEALADANQAEKPVEIHVAQGTYRPNEGLVAIPEFDWRTTTFRLINGVTLKGGYAGLEETNPNRRDTQTYETILSGDLNNNDVDVNDPRDLLNEPSRADNSYHVVTGRGIDNSAELDGFTIIGGNANRDEWRGNSCGGGMYNQSASPTVVNCAFTVCAAIRDGGGMYNHLSSDPMVTGCAFSGNYASYGGGMSNEHSNPTLENCAFSNNHSDWEGGGMLNSYNGPILTNCTFTANSAYSGGGISNFVEGSPTLRDCTFNRNTAEESGGGIYTEYYANPTLDNCTLSWNSASQNGGGMYNHENSDTTLTDCVFKGNSCGNGGGGMWNSMSNPTLRNCIFAQNSADFGGGMVTGFESSATLINCAFRDNSAKGDGAGMDNFSNSSSILTNCAFSGNRAGWSGGGMFNLDSNVVVANCTFVGNSAGAIGGVYSVWDMGSKLRSCILWDNTLPQVGGDTAVSYSDVQGGYEGEGNIDVDPLFASPGYWVDVNDVNTVVDPNDPNAVWVHGDYHLKSQPGRWDPVSESWVVDNVTSPCIDAGDPNSPVADEPEPNGGRINMGAYGGTAEASMSPIAQAIVYIQWLGHSSVKLWAEDRIVYVDPQNLSISPHDATLVCVTHTHGDHYSPSDIARVSNAQTQFIAPPDVVQRYGSGQAIAPGRTIEFDSVRVTAVPAYNTNKPNHPKSNNWVGYIIELGGKRIYVAGDTDLIDEMKSLGDIDVAILPAGGTYTMNAVEAAEATQYIKPDLAIPYHWGRNVGTLSDAQTFAELAHCPVNILAAGEMISSDHWPQ